MTRKFRMQFIPSLPFSHRLIHCVFGLCLGAGFITSAVLAASDNSDRFSQQKSGLFIIQTTDRASDRKLSVGSGFLVHSSGLLATNYHVVSDHVLRPDQFNLRYRGADEVEGDLRVVAVDVVNDLALVRPRQAIAAAADEPTDDGAQALAGWIFDLATVEPLQGADIIAMGNPYDIGLSLVPGIYNGVTNKGFRRHIHFTGALNPGMSGGPAVNDAGEVVGINVAGAGNSVSFLVPVAALATLMQKPETPADDEAQLRQSIQADLLAHQARLIGDLVDGDWSLSEFGPIRIPTQVRDYVNCTADTTAGDPELRYDYHASDCGVHDRIFLSTSLSTGTVEFDYGWYRSDYLNIFQFYNLFENITFSPMNQSARDDVSPYACKEDIATLPGLGTSPLKLVTCARAYLDYDQLYDVLFYAKSLLDRAEGVYLHYTLAGVSLDSARQFNDRFIEAVQWQ